MNDLPNIVIIYADDVGYGDTSAYGAHRILTPNIDRLAADGIRFLHAYAPAATCTPSRYGLMTGGYAFRQPGTGILPGNAALVLPLDRATLPSMLKKAGYQTGLVGKWHLGLGSKTAEQDWNEEITPGPREVGFNYSFIMAATGDRVPCVYLENQKVVGLAPDDPIQVSYKEPFPGERLGRLELDTLRIKPSHGHDMAVVNGISRIGYMKGGEAARWKDEDMNDVFTAKALDFIEDHKGERFFLLLATHDIHVPRVPHSRFVGKSGMGPRGDAILELDWTVGQVRGKLKALGLLENTLIIFSSDNGPVLDDGYQDQAVELAGDHKPAGPLRGGKYSCFEAGSRMPFIVSWPAKVKQGVSAAVVSQVDLLASMARLTGQKLEEKDAPDSQDVLNALLGLCDEGRSSVLLSAASFSLRKGDWKYIKPKAGPAIESSTKIELGLSLKPQLYNLRDDPGETRNLANAELKRTADMAEELDRQMSQGRTRGI